MRILGIDPGSSVTGWGLLVGDPRGARVSEAGTIRLRRDDSFPHRLAILQRSIGELLDRLAPEAAAIESPFHGVNARSSLQLAQARGVILATLAAAGLTIDEYSPATIKKAVTGTGRADKDQVRVLVCRQLAYAETGAPDDLTDALAVALCHVAHGGHRRALAEAGAQARGARATRSTRKIPSSRGKNL